MNTLGFSTKYHGYAIAGLMVGAVFGIVASVAFKPGNVGYNQALVSQNVNMAVPLVVTSCTLLGLGGGMAASYRRCLRERQNRRVI